MVERSFGTGAVKITPAHDHNDYDCGKRRNLPFVEMMDDEGNITGVSPQFKVWREGGPPLVFIKILINRFDN